MTGSGFSEAAVAVMQASRAKSTNKQYQMFWNGFEAFYAQRDIDPYMTDIKHIVNYVEQCRSQKDWAYSSVKGCVAAISAFREKIDGFTVFTHPDMARYLKGAEKTCATKIPRSETWDISLVLNALVKDPFEPLASCQLKWLSAKLAVLMALTTAGRASELCALTTKGLVLSAGGLRATVFPNPEFTPKTVTILYRRAPVVFEAFHPSPVSEEEKRLHLLCPVRAIRIYLERTNSFRRSEQLLVCYARGNKGKALSSQRLAHWLVDGISEAYVRSNIPVPRLTAHSTRGAATSVAVLSGVDWEVVRQSACWTGDSTFLAHYYKYRPVNTLANAVLGQARHNAT